MPAGRPTKYDPKYCDMLVDHCKKGLSFEAFAGLIGISRSTLYRWIEENPEFSDTKERADSAVLYAMETLGMAGTAGKVKNFNVVGWIFQMKNKCKWTDRKELDHITKEPITIAYDRERKDAD